MPTLHRSFSGGTGQVTGNQGVGAALVSHITASLEDPTLVINNRYNVWLASTTMTLEWDPPVRTSMHKESMSTGS